MIDIFIPEAEVDNTFYERYFIVTYDVISASNLREAAWNIAIGQSVGNPSTRSEFETIELFENHSCIVLHSEQDLINKASGKIKIAFPEKNINFKYDGISHLLVQIMGGQCDIDIIKRCVVEKLELTPSMQSCLKGPVVGLREMKKHCGIPADKPLLGGIVKPKTGLTPKQNFELVKQLIDGGCNFIKEDEILSDPDWCRIEDRLPLVADYIKQTNSKVYYCVSIHTDPAHLLDRVKQVYSLGGNGVHVNFHCGMGSYKSIRELNLPILLHYQKSGDKILSCTDHAYHIHHDVLFELAGRSGCSTLHCGMIGGYMDNDAEQVLKTVKMLNDINCVPALSCGMHPGIVNRVTDTVGHGNWLANVGGALSGHPMGTLAGVKAMRQAIDGNYGPEYTSAIDKWGNK